eukprot:2979042-Amphidinium_carterae.1
MRQQDTVHIAHGAQRAVPVKSLDYGYMSIQSLPPQVGNSHVSLKFKLLRIHGAHLIGAWSSTQTIQTLICAEAEFLAMVRGASIGLGAAMARDIELTVGLTLATDSSTATTLATVQGRRR